MINQTNKSATSKVCIYIEMYQLLLRAGLLLLLQSLLVQWWHRWSAGGQVWPGLGPIQSPIQAANHQPKHPTIQPTTHQLTTQPPKSNGWALDDNSEAKNCTCDTFWHLFILPFLITGMFIWTWYLSVAQGSFNRLQLLPVSLSTVQVNFRMEFLG